MGNYQHKMGAVIVEKSGRTVHSPVKPDWGYEHSRVSLVSVTAHTTSRYLKDIYAFISQIKFKNPGKKEIIVKVNNVEYCRTTEDYVRFELPHKHSIPLTPGQIIQKNVRNCATEFISRYFPGFHYGNITGYYLSTHCDVDIELEGLSDDTCIQVDLCKIRTANRFFPEGRDHYATYSPSVTEGTMRVVPYYRM